MAKGRTAKQAAASRANGKQHKGTGRAKPTKAQITKWQSSSRTIALPYRDAIAKVPVMRTSARLIAYFPPKPKKSPLFAKHTQVLLTHFLMKNKPHDPPHLRKKPIAKRPPVRKVLVKRIT